MSVSVRIAGQEDLSAAYRRAAQAASRGDMESLELALTKLRRLNSSGTGTVGTTLRAMARCVQAHPSAGTASQVSAPSP